MEDFEELETHKKLDKVAILSLISGLALGIAGIVFNQYIVLLPAIYLLCWAIAIPIYNMIRFG